MEKVSLYSKDAKGQIRIWSIEEDADGRLITHGVLNGRMQEQEEFLDEGLAGRSLQEQIDLKMESRINKKLDKGYVRSAEEANSMDRKLNSLGLKKPMLAQPLKKVNPKDIDKENAFLQYKYDGNRCLTTNNGEILTYSRNGKEQEALIEIREELKGRLPYDATIDGELYSHGVPLQTIRSWVSRRQVKTAELQYVVYDVMEDIPYAERYAYLQDIFKFETTRIVLAPTRRWDGCDLFQVRDCAIADGYEGLMLRHGNLGYEDDRRSKSLIKIKKFFDDEFTVVDIIESKDGWGILQCLARNGKRFGTPAPGDMNAKENALRCKTQYIGRKITIEYAGLTKEGIPFHPIATAWRDLESE